MVGAAGVRVRGRLMKSVRAAIDDYLQRQPHPLPFQVCIAPEAAKAGLAKLAAGAVGRPRVFPFEEASIAAAGESPAILVVVPQDLVAGPMASRLLEYAQASRPARPVLLGGARNRDVLVDAINTWRIFRVVPEQAAEVLRDAVHQAWQALCVELALKSAAGELLDDTTRLEQALAALRATQQKLLQLERLNTLGRAASSVLPVIALHLNALEEFNVIASAGMHRHDPELQGMLTSALEGMQALRTMLEDLLTYAGSGPAHTRPALVELDKTVASALSFARFDPLANGRAVRAELKTEARVLFDSHRLRQVVLNLLRTAYQSAPSSGPGVTVRTSAQGGDAILEVQCAGAVIPEDARVQIFDPFFTLTGDEGLGLNPCRLIVERYGGTIECVNVTGRGTCFRVRLPRSDMAT